MLTKHSHKEENIQMPDDPGHEIRDAFFMSQLGQEQVEWLFPTDREHALLTHPQHEIFG